MAFMIGQLKKSDFANNAFMKSVSITPGKIWSDSPYKDVEGINASFGMNTEFEDLCFTPGQSFDPSKTYFFRCAVREVPINRYTDDRWDGTQRQLSISVVLRNSSSPRTDIETLGTFIVPAAPSQEVAYYSYYVVFTPVEQCDRIVLKLNRVGYDVLQLKRNWLIEGLESRPQRTNNVLYTGEGGELSLLQNIMPKTIGAWTKMGFQSRPGSLIVVNQSPVRVGRSGTYELHNDMNITSVMIAAPQGTNADYIDMFILDYAYVTS